MASVTEAFIDRPASSAGSERATAAAVILAGILGAGLLLWLVGDRVFALGFAATLAAAAVLVALHARLRRVPPPVPAAADWSLVRAAADVEDQALAVTDRSGRLVCANEAYRDWFGGFRQPLEVGSRAVLEDAARAAWRDGAAETGAIVAQCGGVEGTLRRAGERDDHLIWRFRRLEAEQLSDAARRLIGGEAGQRLGEAGVMVALVRGDGRLLAANRVLRLRALGHPDAEADGRDFVRLLLPGEDDRVRFAAEEDAGGGAIRFVQVPLADRADADALFLLLDDDAEGAAARGSGTAAVHLHGLLGMLPLGLALADRDGRFLFVNDAFRRAAGLGEGERPLYPGDLVVKEDKAAVADAVRRFAGGQQSSGDLAVRLRGRPDDPVVLTIAGARGLGEATVLLSLKDTAEEQKLKRQVAQATKMQAVGQLAGGVAHDFNNILTAIIGHCDLMAMRHAPGDSDYDDIQQIKHNSNRAAGLTRQLLAFSRQQTLRPQLLQLPDVVSEVSNLLKRLLGETVTLTVKHGRGLGAVRADPGQLEQVIVNLAVNARDAMPGGGTLTIQTYAVAASDVARIGSEIMPITDYTALSVSDTGTGIPPEVIGKIFEPFFTTKEVGKGTGLGLSTVYGIVKQTGGFIFADSTPGAGTSFVIYLPVHRAERGRGKPERAKPAEPSGGELWGSGTILLVEDEDMVRAVAERALTRQGYRVLTAANGEEALEVLDREGAVDLLVSDVVMPGMDGPTTVREARRRFPEMAVLFMSGYAEEQLRRSIDIHRVAFLPKPFSVQQLAQAVRDAMPPKPAER